MNTDRIEKKTVLHAPLKRVWRAISDSTEFGSWFGMKFDGPFKPGTAMCGTIVPTTADEEIAKAQKPHEGMVFEIKIEQVESERLLSFRWHPFAIDRNVDYTAEPTTLIIFTLVPAADGVMLTVTESGFDKIPLERRVKAFAANEQGWTMQMKLIEQHLTRAP